MTGLSKDVLHSAHQSSLLRFVVEFQIRIELLEKFALLFGELGRGLHLDFDEQVASATAVEDWYALLS